ncbi:MAG: preprotein translocase subunit SecA [Cardiobacteriaceae bacterium]|nr:preprotein translocase subunit SecA [Cardiobacteriaceae bacterium]
MLGTLATKIFGSRNDRILKQLNKIVKQINDLEPKIKALSDTELKAKTQEFKERLQHETLDQLLPESFAVVREASRRVLGMRHHDVQLIGGMVLHQGKIPEMRTGEGKTLVATLAVYLNALSGKGVHVVTVNDYLASRDGVELGELYRFLGLSTGIILSGMTSEQKRAAYQADITYGTNNEFGFDYLRTNMAHDESERLQRELHYAIIDEVDSILIDEARTPLIISGPADANTDLYLVLNELVPHLKRQEVEDGEGDFSIDEKTKQVGLTDEGHDRVEALLREKGLLNENEGLYHPKNLGLFHHLNACLRAHHLFHRDVDYLVRDGEVMIVDEFTGRVMEGRRWSDGLHQAIEVKEGVMVKQENQTLASITYQNYFRLYEKLAGMTGTADTEAAEFQEIYGLETVIIPTNRPVQRIDHIDQIYLNQKGKYQAIINDVREAQSRKQPVLLGTASIETSELVSSLLTQAGIRHNVLNAKQHEREAEIIAQAGRPAMVTIATNMAGRGTDIVLGGSLKADLAALPKDASEEERQAVKSAWQARHDEVIRAGGLHVIGAERHESRRIDNQLRGRSGRQGDPGSSRFYVALDDNLVRIFAGDRMASMMGRFGMSEDEAIESKMISRQIEGAQRKVEAHNFDARKNILEYDNVANEQRKVIYSQRSDIMDSPDISDLITQMRHEVVLDLVDKYLPADQVRQHWNTQALEQDMAAIFSLGVDIQKHFLEQNPDISSSEIAQQLNDFLDQLYAKRIEHVDPEFVRNVEKRIVLMTIDQQWKNHLSHMDMLRQAIWLRSRAQKDPKQEYKKESFEMFNDLMNSIRFEVIGKLSHLHFEYASNPPAPLAPSIVVPEVAPKDEEPDPNEEGLSVDKKPPVGRNEPCTCGSGKKYKECHGRLK